MKKILVMLLAFTLSIALISCGSGTPSTKIAGSWKNPSYTGKKFQNILVVGVSNDIVKRTIIEKALVRALTEKKIIATTGTSVLPPDVPKVGQSGNVDTSGRAELKSKLQSMGYDGVVLVALLDVKDKQTYVQGSTYYAPSHHYLSPGYGFYGYWYPSYQYISTPGYYVNEKEIFLETTLFDLKTEELLWSTESETLNPSDVKELAISFSSPVASRMIKDKAVLR